MKIAVNTRLLLKNRFGGIGTFALENLRRIVQQHPEHQFYFIFDRSYDEEFIFSDNVTPVVTYPQSRHPYLWYLFFEYGIPYQLYKIKPDLFLSVDGMIPVHLKGIKVVNVIHDLNFEHHPDFIKPVVLRYYKRYFHQFAHAADRIATVSEFSRQDIHKLYDVPLDKIDVVYSGYNENFKPLEAAEQQKVREQFAQGAEYYLFVGMIHQRKNLANIFRAFDTFKEREPNSAKLVIVGEKKWWRGEIEDTYNAMKFKKDVLLLGQQPMEVVYKLYASARAVLYPSFFEGFGLPILEGFHSETAVITSNVTSMPEIAGDAAMLVDPYSVSQIADAMLALWKDEKLRNDLISKGRARRYVYSWQQTSELLWQTIEKCSRENG